MYRARADLEKQRLSEPGDLEKRSFIVANFSGKVALVTGASSGIGRKAALAFAQEKARVVVADVDGDGGGATVEMFGLVQGLGT